MVAQRGHHRCRAIKPSIRSRPLAVFLTIILLSLPLSFRCVVPSRQRDVEQEGEQEFKAEFEQKFEREFGRGFEQGCKQEPEREYKRESKQDFKEAKEGSGRLSVFRCVSLGLAG